MYSPTGAYLSYHRTLQAAHLKALTEAYKKGADGYQVRWDDKVGIVTRSFQSAPNDDGDVVVPNPGGSASLSWNTLNLPSMVGLFTGTPTSHNVRQYLSGTLAATAPITIVVESGSTIWTMVGNNFTHPGTPVGSGSVHFHAEQSGVSADSPSIPWSYIVQPPLDPAAYTWAPSDGLDNGTGAGNWVVFNGATLNANPNADGYLQISYSTEWSGISSHHATPTFVAGFEYEVMVNIDAGGSRDRVWVQLGLGPAVVFSGTGAITHNVMCGSGTPNMVLHANGETAAIGQNTRIAAISADPVEDVFSLTSATHSVNLSAGTLEIGVLRSTASSSSATLTITRTSGTNAVAQLVDSSFSWAANEGGTKFATLQLNGAGSVTLTISSPSVGSLGTITQTVVTVSATAATGDWPRLGMVWIGNDDALGGHLNQYQSATGIAEMARRHTVVITRWPELQGATGVSTQSIAAAVKAASTVGTRIFNYCDQDAVYKDSATSAWATKRAKMAAMGWYLYASGASGATVDSYFSNTLTTLNNTSFVPSDSNGMKCVQWILDHTQNFTVEGGDGNAPAPAMDGPYMDNIINSPRVSGDWNRTGGADTVASPFAPPWNVTPKTWYRQGIAAGVAAFRASHPGVPVIGNLEFMNVASKSDLPEYDQTFDGGSLEAVVGLPSSYETWMDTATLVQRLQNAEDMMRDPLLGIVTGNPTDGSATNYQEFRHFLCMVYTVTNMCAGWTRWTPFWSDWDTYDEYNVAFGQRTTPRQTAATQNGIWRGDFQNVITLWCPRGVTGTINLGGPFRILTGNAAAGRTPNSTVTSITFLGERDGIVLARP